MSTTTRRTPDAASSSRRAIPARGVDRAELLDTMQGFRARDADWKHGRAFSLVYYPGDEHYAFLQKAHSLFFAENALNPMAFKSLKRMEAEVVQMTASMLNGPAACVGTMTSGGTESILLAVKAARDRARAKRPWVRSPEMVLPRTAHVAFAKAAHYFDVKPRYVPVGPDQRADPEAMRRAINRNTVLMVASAPQYPHGLLDPIPELGVIAQEHGLPFHVDACVGGFMLPWVERLGVALDPWDFRVPGVTSISADLHKYGYAPKGASTVMYRDMSYLKHQFFVETDWPGGVYISPSMPGTRPGGTIAAAWATMMALGEEGYLDLTRKALDAQRVIAEGVRAIPELTVIGEPKTTLLAWGAAPGRGGVDVYAVADQLEDRGWHIDRQQDPPTVHLTLMAQHAPIAHEYVADLRAAVATVRANPRLRARGNAAMYGMMARVPVRAMIKYTVGRVMEQMYGPNGGADDPMAATAGQNGHGEGHGDGNGSGGMLGGLMERYGDRVMGALDALSEATARIRGGRANGAASQHDEVAR